MCAPNGLRMEAPPISRFNSRSTNNSTLIGSENGLTSPVSPFLATDLKIAPSPYLQTGPNNKQWIDLDYVSPKLLRELRRQYDPSSNAEASHPLAKSAAKVKAWVRQNKLGIDIRLRRKINAEHDEVTDISLVPEPALVQDQKLPMMSELPGAMNEISELPDSSVPQELPTTTIRDPSTSPMGSPIAEPPPVYEPPSNNAPAQSVSDVPVLSDLMDEGSTIHRRSCSQSSIVATPQRGLSLERVETKASESYIPASEHERESSPHSTTPRGGPSGDVLSLNVGQAHAQAGLEREARERFEALLQDVQDVRDQLVKQRSDARSEETSGRGSKILGGLKVAETTRYETETDVEPPSPSERRSRPAVRSKKALITSPAKRKKSGAKAQPPKTPVDGPSGATSHGRQAHSTGLVERQATIPKRTPATAGTEELWAALLRAQSKLIGPEHPLTYQARSDLARSRADCYVTGGHSSLAALHESNALAAQLLGTSHPLVATFSADLSTLEELLRRPSAAKATVTEGKMKEHPSTLADTEEARSSASTAEVETKSPENANRKQSLPLITTSFHPANEEPATAQIAQRSASGDPWLTWRPPHQPRNAFAVLCSLVFAALTRVALNSILWLQRNYGPEETVEPGKVRVRWTCACGQQMHDDFVERRPGAARELEAYLNRPRMHAGGTPTSPSSSHGSRSFTNSTFGSVPSSQTSWSSCGFQQGSPVNGDGTKPPGTFTGLPFHMPFNAPPEPPWLLTCANEDRYTPKLAHLDMAPHIIRSDKDLAMSLRNHYFNVNKKWYRVLKLRGLTTIEFVQFEVHQNRFADIRKSPDVPPSGATSEYSFEAGDLLPPVGSHYLLHLFKHPEDYDGELITYLRAPKKNGRLTLGRGWGISLVEGFEASKVWLMVSTFFAVGSIVFAIAWASKRHDVQGAFGVAAWLCTLAGLAVGWLQASLG